MTTPPSTPRKTATIKLELLSDSGATIASDEVRVAVNVDQYAVLPVVVAQNKDAIPLRGMHPHYAGIQDQPVGGTSGRIRAVTGTFTCRVPSFKSSKESTFFTQLTPMHDNIFRDHIGEKSSGQSIWVGVKQQLPNGNFTWAQCGLRWWWKPAFREPYSTPPHGYVEAGTSYQGVPYIGRAEKFPGTGSTGVRSLLNWHQEPVIVDFMLWKEIVATKADGSDTVLAPWRAIFRDARPGADPTDSGCYTRLSASAARPDSGNNATLMDALDNIYMAQNMNLLDAKMECNNSVSFAVGSTSQKAVVSGLKTAAGLRPAALPAPQGSDLPALWDWMRDSYGWDAVAADPSRVGITVRNGRNDGSPAPGKAADGSSPHPYWRLQAATDGFSLWDERPYGFGEIQINSRP